MPNVRTATEHISNLPPYTATKSEQWPDWLIVVCPREACGCSFVVHRRHWYKASDKIGRSCPYCYMTSRLPKPRDIKRPPRG